VNVQPGQDNLRKLEKMKEEAFLCGGTKRIETQHKKGKLTARERILLLLDDDSFEEFDLLMTGRAGIGEYPGDGVITGHGTIAGRGPMHRRSAK
jgi:propionyl-CoA carboxylase beta chain